MGQAADQLVQDFFHQQYESVSYPIQVSLAALIHDHINSRSIFGCRATAMRRKLWDDHWEISDNSRIYLLVAFLYSLERFLPKIWTPLCSAVTHNMLSGIDKRANSLNFQYLWPWEMPRIEDPHLGVSKNNGKTPKSSHV